MSDATRVSPGVAPSGQVDADHMLRAGPGWYYDPADEAIYRYWDGERWTDRLSDTVTTEIPRPTQS